MTFGFLNAAGTRARMRRIAGEFFWVVTGQCVAALGALAGVRLLTERLDPSSYGQLALGMTAAMLAQQVLLSPLSAGSVRYFSAARESSSLRTFLAACRSLLLRASIWMTVIFGAGAVIAASIGLTHWLPLAVAAFAFSLFAGLATVLDGMQNAARQRLIVAWHDGLNQWARFLIAFFLTGVVARTSTVAMTGFAIGSALVLASQWFFFRRILPRDRDPIDPEAASEWRRKIVAYAWPIGTWGLFYWAQAASDRWSLEVMRTSADVGRYAVVYQLGYYPVILLTGVVTQLVSPIIFERAGGTGDPARVAQGRRITDLVMLGAVAATALGVAAAVVLHRVVFRIFVAAEFRDASPLLPWLVLAGGIFAIGQIASLAIMTERDTRRLLIPRVATALLGVALNFLGAATLGIRGVVWAGVAVASIFTIWALVLMNRRPVSP